MEQTVEAVQNAVRNLPGGYIGVFGPPGSGKSTLLTRTLRALPIRLVRYYAYIPEAQDPSTLRGESTNFLHDITLRLRESGFYLATPPDPSDRSALLALFYQQLQALGNDYAQSGTKTIILVDGLDHIAREQKPERSLLLELPLPTALPAGVYIVLGSQTSKLSDLPLQIADVLQQTERRIEMARLKPADVHAIIESSLATTDASERQQIYELSGGHPLALIYLLKQLEQMAHAQARTTYLAQAIDCATPVL